MIVGVVGSAGAAKLVDEKHVGVCLPPTRNLPHTAVVDRER